MTVRKETSGIYGIAEKKAQQKRQATELSRAVERRACARPTTGCLGWRGEFPRCTLGFWLPAWLKLQGFRQHFSSRYGTEKLSHVSIRRYFFTLFIIINITTVCIIIMTPLPQLRSHISLPHPLRPADTSSLALHTALYNLLAHHQASHNHFPSCQTWDWHHTRNPCNS